MYYTVWKVTCIVNLLNHCNGVKLGEGVCFMKGIQLIFKDWKAMWHHKHGRIALIFINRSVNLFRILLGWILGSVRKIR